MEAGVQLGLIEKLRSLFAADGFHLLCPPTPPIYEVADLDAIGRGSATAEELTREADWIRALNVVPPQSALTPADPRFLWEVLSEIKKRATAFAAPAPNKIEAAEIEAAKALLFKNPEAATREFTDAYNTYLQYQTLHREAVLRFHQRRGEVELSTDPEVKDFWRTVAAPSYQAEIDQASFKWGTLGRKNEIENAQRLFTALGEREPETQWVRWMGQFSSEVDSKSDLNLREFVATSFSPDNVASLGDWPETTIEHAQLLELNARAPEELRKRFSSADTGVQSISFEYAQLSIERAWFPRRAFETRFWRFRDAGAALSDGANPPGGELPGYIVSALLVRNLSVTVSAEEKPPKPTLSPFMLWPAATTFAIHGARVEKPTMVVGGFRHVAAATTPARTEAIAGAGVAHRAVDPQILNTVAYRRANFPSRGVRNVAEFASLGKLDRDMQGKIELLRRKAFIPAVATTKTEAILKPSEVCVIAFLWRGFPKCPDPDPGFVWSA